jgi:hypothetical protein
LSLVEILCAVGFLAVFTTGLLAIATKGFTLSEGQVDMASAYQYGEEEMERYALLARDPDGWAEMAAVTTPTFPTKTDAGGTSTNDTRFVYTVTLEELDSDLRLVTVIIYRAEPGQAAAGTPSIHTSAPRGGELLRFTNLYQQEVNDA